MKRNKQPIRRSLVFLGISELAGRIGVSKQHLSMVLHGRRPSARVMRRVLELRPELATAEALRASGVDRKGKAVRK